MIKMLRNTFFSLCCQHSMVTEPSKLQSLLVFQLAAGTEGWYSQIAGESKWSATSLHPPPDLKHIKDQKMNVMVSLIWTWNLDVDSNITQPIHYPFEKGRTRFNFQAVGGNLTFFVLAGGWFWWLIVTQLQFCTKPDFNIRKLLKWKTWYNPTQLRSNKNPNRHTKMQNLIKLERLKSWFGFICQQI